VDNIAVASEEYNPEVTDDDCNVKIEKVFNNYALNEGEIRAVDELFNKSDNTSDKIFNLFNKSSIEGWKNEKKLIESSPFFVLLKNVQSKQNPENYEKIQNNSKDCILSKEDNFMDYAVFSLHSKMNKATNNRVDHFNKEMFNSYFKKKVDWERFKINFENKRYCYCCGEYIFYTKEDKQCKHNKPINSLNYIGISSVLDILACILSNEQNYNDINKKNKEGKNSKETISEEDRIFDINDALMLKLCRINGYYNLADICMSIVCWTDKFSLENGTSICVVLASISELGFEKRIKEQILIPIAA